MNHIEKQEVADKFNKKMSLMSIEKVRLKAETFGAGGECYLCQEGFRYSYGKCRYEEYDNCDIPMIALYIEENTEIILEREYREKYYPGIARFINDNRHIGVIGIKLVAIGDKLKMIGGMIDTITSLMMNYKIQFILILDIPQNDIIGMSSLFSGIRDIRVMSKISGEIVAQVPIIDLSNFYTGKCATMAAMFCDCGVYEIVGIENIDTGNCIDMCNMFGNCRGLKSIDMRKWDTTKTRDMSYMFSGSSIRAVRASGINTSSLENTRNMFSRCDYLRKVDFEVEDTNKLTDMQHMFQACTANEINMHGWNFKKGMKLSKNYLGQIYWDKHLSPHGLNIIGPREIVDRLYEDAMSQE